MLAPEALHEALLTDDPSSITEPAATAFHSFADTTGADLLALAAQTLARHGDRIPLEDLTVPTLVLVGRYDPLTTGPEVLARAIPGSSLRLVPGTTAARCTSPTFGTPSWPSSQRATRPPAREQWSLLGRASPGHNEHLVMFLSKGRLLPLALYIPQSSISLTSARSHPGRLRRRHLPGRARQRPGLRLPDVLPARLRRRGHRGAVLAGRVRPDQVGTVPEQPLSGWTAGRARSSVLIAFASSAAVSLPLSSDPPARIQALYAAHQTVYVVAQVVGLVGVVLMLFFVPGAAPVRRDPGPLVTATGLFVALAALGTNVSGAGPVLRRRADAGRRASGAAVATDVTDDVLSSPSGCSPLPWF